MSRSKKRKKHYGFKIVLTIFVICLSVVMAGGLYVYRVADKIKVDNPNDVEDKQKDEDNVDVEKPDLVFDEEISNILLIGTDDRKDGEGERADAIMILTLDNKNKGIRLTSIMRDSYVKIPASKGRKESWEKINHSYAYGGATLLRETIEENFKIKLDEFVKIDFSGFKSIVEKVGGVEVDITSREELNELNRCLLLDIYDDPDKRSMVKFRNILERAKLLKARDEGAKYLIEDNPNITKAEYNYIAEVADFKEDTGITHLDGRQTLAYSRMRHSTGGSMGRTSRQREVVDLLLEKIPDLNIIEKALLVDEVFNYIKTNIGINDIKNYGELVLAIDNFDIKQLQLPPEELTEGRLYEGFNNLYVFLMDLEQVNKVLHEFVFEDIEYDSSKYKRFDYKNSEYYIAPPPEPEEVDEEETPKEEDGDKNEGDSQKPDEGETQKPDEGSDENEGDQNIPEEGSDNGDKDDAPKEENGNDNGDNVESSPEGGTEEESNKGDSGNEEVKVDKPKDKPEESPNVAPEKEEVQEPKEDKKTETPKEEPQNENPPQDDGGSDDDFVLD